jgi:hypothetical protein
MQSLRRRPAESSRGALRLLGFGLSASAPRLHSPRLPSRLTSRSSRRRFVASLKIPGMRAILATNRRVRRGLTLALGGRIAFSTCVISREAFPASALLSSGSLSARPVFGYCTVRAQMLQALRLPASETAIIYCSFFRAGPAPSETAGGKFARRARAFHLRFSARAPGLRLHRHPTRLTIRSSRPRIVASATCLRYASTRPPPRYGAA